MRFRDESAAIWEAYPSEYVDLAVVVTELGGLTGVVIVLSLAYWLSRRRERAALVASYAVVGIAFVMFLKSTLAMPRPPPEVYAIPLQDDPYGFPSGHAFIAVVVYGGLVLAYDRVRDPLAVAGAATLVVLISLSRIVLGVHYLGDVVVGAVLGVAFLAALHVVVDGDPTRGFLLGGAVAIPAVVVSGEAYAFVGLGSALGGAAAWTWLESTPPRRSRGEGIVVSVVGLGFLAGMDALRSAVAASDVAIVVVHAALIAGVLLAPAAFDRLQWRTFPSRS